MRPERVQSLIRAAREAGEQVFAVRVTERVTDKGRETTVELVTQGEDKPGEREVRLG